MEKDTAAKKENEASKAKKVWNDNIALFAKKYPKQIFIGFFCLLMASLAITSYQIYTVDQSPPDTTYKEEINNIGPTMSEDQMIDMNEMVKLRNSVNESNPIKLYNKLDEAKALQVRIQRIREKPVKTRDDSLELLEILNSIKELSNE